MENRVQPNIIIVIIVLLLQFTASIILACAEFLACSSPATHRYCLRSVSAGRSPMTYRHGINAIELQEIPLFVSLLEDIRNHFLLSELTQLIYASIVQQFFLDLDPTVRGKLKRPTARDFYNYVFNNWPIFRSFRPPFAVGVGVEKGDLELNEVNISSDIVASAATWDFRHRLPLDLYRLIITIIILHEISHSFAKHYLNQLLTPLGVDISSLMSKYGECGWLAERELFGGRFFIYWDDKEDEGNMAAISHVVLDDSDSEWEIDANVASKLLSSFRSPKLDWPARSTLRPYLPTSGSLRARLTGLNKSVSTTAIPSSQIRLGFNPKRGAFSYIGGDRRI